MRAPSSLFAAALVVASAAVIPSAAAADAYDDSIAWSRALEEKGDLAGALRVLRAAEPSYPQDYQLVLQIAWLEFRLGLFPDAERHYRAAAALSRGSVESRLGLAWTLARLGRCAEARPELLAILRERPDHEGARDGLTRCAPPPAQAEAPRWILTPLLAGTEQFFDGNLTRSHAAGVTAGLTAFHGGFLLKATYRYTELWSTSQPLLSPWSMREVHVEAGYAVPRFGASFQYGIVQDGSGLLGISHHVGFSARYSRFGDVLVNGALSFYDDMKVVRVEPSWRLPITSWLSVRPGAALQYAASQVLATGMLTVSLDGRPGSVFAGGKYGSEIRPAHLDIPVVYAIEEQIKYGFWAGASLNVADVWRIQLTYSMDRLEDAAGTSGTTTAGASGSSTQAAPSAASAHYLTLGLSRSF